MILKYSVLFCSAIIWCFIDELSTQFVMSPMQSQISHKAQGGFSHNSWDSDDQDHSKKHDGGYKQGKHDWNKGEHKKLDQDWGKFGKQDHDNQHKWGDTHSDKNSMMKHGDKWTIEHGAKKSNDFTEWKDNHKWNKDKGNGYVKKWSWDKEDGLKDAHGKKQNYDDNHYKNSKGHKDALKKYHDQKSDKHGDKHLNSNKDWKDYGKKYSDSGDKHYEHKTWDEKKPHYYQFQKLLKSSSDKGKKYDQDDDNHGDNHDD